MKKNLSALVLEMGPSKDSRANFTIVNMGLNVIAFHMVRVN